ncbi:hypothetical protein LguiA_008054 [Lonicera macranthoides]
MATVKSSKLFTVNVLASSQAGQCCPSVERWVNDMGKKTEVSKDRIIVGTVS